MPESTILQLGEQATLLELRQPLQLPLPRHVRLAHLGRHDDGDARNPPQHPPIVPDDKCC